MQVNQEKQLRALRALIGTNIGQVRLTAENWPATADQAQVCDALKLAGDYLLIGRMWLGEALNRAGVPRLDSSDIINTGEEFSQAVMLLMGAEAAEQSE